MVPRFVKTGTYNFSLFLVLGPGWYGLLLQIITVEYSRFEKPTIVHQVNITLLYANINLPSFNTVLPTDTILQSVNTVLPCHLLILPNHRSILPYRLLVLPNHFLTLPYYLSVLIYHLLILSHNLDCYSIIC
jgi:hypothetical protein